MSFSDHLRSLRAPDRIAIAFYLLMSVLILSNTGTIDSWPVLLFLNATVCIGIVILAHVDRKRNNAILRLTHDWYLVPLVFVTFKEMYVYIHSMGLQDRDSTLIAIDRWLFGVDPTVWLGQFSSPVVTEILQISYASFYVLMMALGVELYLRKEEGRFLYSIFAITYGFYLSYLGYMLVPGVGPRFTLHEFQLLDSELPGLWLTPVLRDFVNAGESIPKGALNAMALAQRDVFPSGHTQMTLITMYLVQKYRLSSRYVVHILGTLLIIGTVYLRYHYVIDLVGGGVFMIFTIWTGRYLYGWMGGGEGKGIIRNW
jgi:membrane-associated phospholipid phosphatase